MKILSFFFVLFGFYSFSQVSPPVISPTSALISLGGSISLTASGCVGTVNWSSGQTGSVASITPKQATRISATCTVGNQMSFPSNISVLQVDWGNPACGGSTTINGNSYNSNTQISSSGTITLSNTTFQPTSNSIVLGRNAVNIIAGSQVQTGSVFKAEAGRCNEFITKDLITNLAYPWEILWGPDNFIWMTERGGKVSRVNPQTGAVQTLITIADVNAQGEGGLLGMVLHPDFTNIPHVFVVYNYQNNGIKEKVVRYTYDPQNNLLTNPIIIIQNIIGNTTHNGSRMIISPDLKLFITTGDAQVLSSPQSTSHLSGKILRLNLDGSIPSDNPILVGNSQPNEIWSIGHRNPQGMVLANGKLYVSSHGANIEDEINLIQMSGNYGWPNVEGPCNTPTEISFCNTTPVISPIFSSGASTWAFCGLDFYNNDNYPRWKGKLVMVSLKNQTFYTFQLSADGNSIIGQPSTYFVNQFGRLRDIAISPDGKVYICTSNGNDKIIEITPFID